MWAVKLPGLRRGEPTPTRSAVPHSATARSRFRHADDSPRVDPGHRDRRRARRKRRPDQAADEPRAGNAVRERAPSPPATCRRCPRLAALVANGYYVDQDSDERAGTPSLRRKQLDVAGGAPTIVDLQIVPGVEDLQVEFGADFNDDQNADYFVQPNTAIPAGDQIVAVRVWLLVRAEQQETGFTDGRTYNYASRVGATSTRRRMRSAGSSSARRSHSGTHGDERHAHSAHDGSRARPSSSASSCSLVLTILAVSGVFTSTMELRMVRNTQSQERAFQAAEVAIEDALANPVLSTSAGFNQADDRRAEFTGRRRIRIRLQFVGQAPLGTGMTGYSIGSAFQTYHFQVDATGNRPGQRRRRITPRVSTSSGRAPDAARRHMTMNDTFATQSSVRAPASRRIAPAGRRGRRDCSPPARAAAAPQLKTIEECLESGTRAVSLPGTASGSLSANHLHRLPVPAPALRRAARVYFIGKDQVTYATLPRGGRQGRPAPRPVLRTQDPDADPRCASPRPAPPSERTDMNKTATRLLTFACAAVLTALGCAASADEAEIFVGTGNTVSERAARTSCSSSTPRAAWTPTSSTQVPFNPATDWPGTCADDRVYFQTAVELQQSARPATTDNSVPLVAFKCNAALTNMALAGYYIADRAPPSGAPTAGAASTATPAIPSGSNAAPTPASTATASAPAPCGRPTATTAPGRANSAQAISWNQNGANNELRLLIPATTSTGCDNGSTITQTRLEIVQQVATSTINQLAVDDAVNVGLMQFSNNTNDGCDNTGTSEGGMVLREMGPVAANARELLGATSRHSTPTAARRFPSRCTRPTCT